MNSETDISFCDVPDERHDKTPFSLALNDDVEGLKAILTTRSLLEELDRPVVLKGMIKDWPILKWTLQDWSQNFGANTVRFRIGNIQQPPKSDPLWETDCRYIDSTFEEFNRWQNKQIPKPSKDITDVGEPAIENATKFSDIDSDVFWGYADYKYMIHIFPDGHPIFDTIDWRDLGLPCRGGIESTLWIGSPHCNTPCHSDTYGSNYVAQIMGKKRWVLFPPNQTDYLYPSRVPFEESSVFSSVNMDDPNNYKFPKFRKATPYVITLEPGDVLFVPHRWWHYVKSLTTSVSINNWTKLDVDDDRRLEEAVTKTVMSGYMSSHAKDEGLKWLNPNESYSNQKKCHAFVQVALKECLVNLQHVYSDEEYSDSEEDYGGKSAKRQAIETSESILSRLSSHIQVLKPMTFTDYIKDILLKDETDYPLEPSLWQKKQTLEVFGIKDTDEDDEFKINLLNALVHPEVISLVCKKLKNAYV